ncbi:MAG TPA: VWA domain-containing protein [Terriglobales bacterium]|nr:VWA domain-containing protein [Terriglobales bacterium]
MMPLTSGRCGALAPRLLLVGAAAMLATLSGAAQQTQAHPQVPIIHATTTLVDVPVLVLDKRGQPMDQMSQDDFQIYDNGVLQRLAGFDNEPRPLSLAIVVDTSDYDAIGQAKRSAQQIRDMVLGATGQAAVFTPGPEPRKLLDFTSDSNKVADVLSHLQKSPTAPLGEGTIIEPLNLAVLDLKHQPRERTRAALVISKSSSKTGAGAQALIESGMSDAIPIFHLSPNHPKGMPDYVNPDSTSQRGTGQGSQREQAPASPVDMHGQPTSSAGNANLDLAPIIGAAKGLATKVLAPHNLDYVYASGGVYYSAGNDNDFDQKLSLIGDELRTIYHLYYSPNNLSATAELHQITIKLDLPATASVGNTEYRRTYVGIQATPH